MFKPNFLDDGHHFEQALAVLESGPRGDIRHRTAPVRPVSTPNAADHALAIDQFADSFEVDALARAAEALTDEYNRHMKAIQ